MKRIILLFAFITSGAFTAVDLNKTIPELSLNDGRKLRNVVFVAYSTSAVMAKWEGGRGTISYDALPAEIGEAARTMRPKSRKIPAQKTPTAPPGNPKGQAIEVKEVKGEARPAQPRTLTGQVFVATRGAGPYKFTGVQVLAYPYSIFDEVRRAQRVLGPAPVYDSGTMPRHSEAWRQALSDYAPCGSATTDAEGKYAIYVNCEADVFLFCSTTRLVGRTQEYNLWVVRSSGAGTVNLDGSNSLF